MFAPAGQAEPLPGLAVAQFVPAGAVMEHAIAVDLDSDGVSDRVIIVRFPAATVTGGARDRQMIVLRGIAHDGVKRFIVIGTSRKALLCSTCGGEFWGDKNAPVSLHRSGHEFETSQKFGGTRVHTQRLRYALRGGVVKLVKVHDHVQNTLTGNRVVSDTNLVTGEHQTTSIVPRLPDRTVHIRIKPVPLADVWFRDPLGAAG